MSSDGWVAAMSKPCSSGKTPYASKADAKRGLKRVRQRVAVRRVYRCPECGLWHLTSQRSRILLKREVV
jgi:hypothetical protein